MDTTDTSDVMLAIPEVHNAVAVDFHHAEQRVYYTDVFLREIRHDTTKKKAKISILNLAVHDFYAFICRRAFLNGSNVQVLVKNVNSDGIAVDWIAKNLYWTRSGEIS